ncbi:MAG TPA: FAD-dependent oxidoreductase [Candidatus Paceibacterota bacterium]|jgi:alkyl hydroperoxide reductase subunit F|nr:FAD-dependent oxidoreductase [Candidatus Paceibacterota bacterium]
MEYDLIIIGGAPAGVSAAVYAARKRLKTLVIAEEVGGQSAVSDTIYNWIGTPEISGPGLAENLRKHLDYYTKDGSLALDIGSRAEKVEKTDTGFTVSTGKSSYTTKSVLVATGSRHRQLETPGAANYEHKGILYCATCDGPLFSDQPVAVVGGGNAALEAVLQLSQYCSHVTLLHRSNEFRADPITVEKVKALENTTVITNVTLTEVTGTEFVGGLKYKNNGSPDAIEQELAVNAIFVEIGQLPNTELIKDVVTLNEYNKIVVDPMNQRTSTLGIWAAGDCTNGLYHQNNIAAGDAVKAVEDLYIWLKKS